MLLYQLTHCTLCANNQSKRWTLSTNLGNVQHNVKRNDILQLNDHFKDTQPWFHTEPSMDTDSNSSSTRWDKEIEDLGYIPTQITTSQDQTTNKKFQKLIVMSRHDLWSDYWKNYIQILNTTTTTHTSSLSPSQEGNSSSGVQEMLAVPLVAGLSLGSQKRKGNSNSLKSLDVGSTGKKLKQTIISNTFSKR